MSTTGRRFNNKAPSDQDRAAVLQRAARALAGFRLVGTEEEAAARLAELRAESKAYADLQRRPRKRT